MRKVNSLANRLVALFLSIVMVFGMLPAGATAVSSSVITTTLGDTDYVVGQMTEFTVTTVGNEDTGAMVLGSFEIKQNGSAVNIADVAKLEYKEASTGNWYEFYGDFGPAETGFPLQELDTTSNFRVTFSKAGDYTIKVFIKTFEGGEELCSAEETISVAKANPAAVTTTLDEQSYTVGKLTPFTVTTAGNEDTGVFVLGSFEIKKNGTAVNIADVAKLEYQDSSNSAWYEFYGDFGPAATGFPLLNATSNFRVTFLKDGEYTVRVFIKKFADGAELCSVTKNISVAPKTQAVLNTDISEKTFEVNQEVEVSYKTIANDYAETLVLGTFVVTKDGADAKDSVASLEYWDVNTESWQSFYGDFGPASGFPLTNATSRFRVKFKETGKYSVEAKIIQAANREELAVNTTEIEVKDTIAPEVVEITGNATEWTNESVQLTVIATDNSGNVFEYSLDGENWQKENLFIVDENGSYTFYAKDAAGNVSTVSDSVDVTFIDKVAPVVNQITFDPDTWTNQTVTITVFATDFGVNGISYKLDNGEWQSENTFQISDNDTHYVYVKDSLGNESASPVAVVADKYDTVAPIINSITPDTTDWVSDQVTITVDAEDGGAKGITYKLGDGDWQANNEFVITKNGTYKVYVKDSLGNEIQEPATITINNIDDAIPEIEGLTSTTEAWTNQNVIITGTVKDSQSGVYALQYKIGDGDWNTLPFSATDGTFTLTVSNECDTIYTFRCVDNVGRVSIEHTKEVKIDKTQPNVTSNSASQNWEKVQFPYSGTISDSASGIQSAVYTNGKGDEGELTIVGSNYAFTTNVSSSGEYIYTITVTDVAGNVKTIRTDVVKIDLDDPVVSVQPATVWANQEVKVVIEATDANAGIRKVSYKKDGKEPVEIGVIDGNYTLVISNAANDNSVYEIFCEDASGRISQSVYYTAQIDVVKPQKPTITYTTALGYRILERVTFGLYKAPVTVTIESSDDLSGLKEIKYYLNDTEYPAIPDTQGKISFIVPADNQYEISAVAYDNAGNSSEAEKFGSDGENSIGGVIVDKTLPKVENLSVDVQDWTSGEVVISGQVSDNLSGVEKVFYKKGQNGELIEVTNFNNTQNTFSFVVSPQSYHGEYYICCVDYSTNFSEEQAITVWMDNVDPSVDTWAANITEWTNGDVTISGKVSDDLSGVTSVYWRQGDNTKENPATLNTDGTYTFTVSARDYEGLIYIGCYDATGNKSGEKNVAVYMDATAPSVDSGSASTADWTNGDVIITGTVSDRVVNGVVSQVVEVQYAYDNSGRLTAALTDDGKYTLTIPATNFDGVVSVWCIDDAGNESARMDISVKMDTTKPTVETGTAVSADWTNQGVVVSGIVKDPVENNSVSNVATVMYKYNNGNDMTADFDGTKYTINIPQQDYMGDVTVWCIDHAGNVSEVRNISVKMDVSVPTDVEIKYTESVISKIINAITFGFYNADTPLQVTISAKDNLALEKIAYSVSGANGEWDSTDASFGDTVAVVPTERNAEGDVIAGSITFNVPAEFKGKIEAVAYDSAGNNTQQMQNDKVYTEVIVDTIAPIIDIHYEAKDAENTTVQFVDAGKTTVESFTRGTQAYYNGDVNATISIKENNFFEGKQITDAAGNPTGKAVHCVGVLLTKTDDNGVVTKTEYLPAGAEKLFDEADNTVEFSWDHNGNVHTYTIPYAENADYQITVLYTDFSQNGAEISANDGTEAEGTYTSKVVTVDKEAPVVVVDYQNKDLKATARDRRYYTENQTAVITVHEHNFRAKDFLATVTAKYSDATDVSVEDFAAILTDDSKWEHNGNEHTITLNYVVDANYTFDYTYKDLAQNDAAAYAEDAFTVDKLNPHTPTVKYEGDVKLSVIDQVLKVLTFGYYDAKVKVTITADDDVAGIDHFVYSYTKNDGVSDVNASLDPTTIESTSIVQNGKTFTATFEIPKDVLTNTNQFNGTVSFVAYDRATRSNKHQETATIIVDNIAPTAKITYNAPVQTANGISYYDGDINATIVINEANFDAKDVVVTVTKDGENFPVNVSWKDDSVDTHTGTFTLTKDGDYVVSVQYKDKSGNQMTSYKSNELTLDATKPTIKVSNIKANSANKDEKYGFVITVNDTNLDASSLKPVLKAVVQKEDGVYVTKEIDLGEAKTVVNGQTYTYTVEDLPDDGFYTLTCEVKDMSANGMSQIVLDDGESYDQVQFSINRNGSAFGYGNKFTEELVGQYYIYSVDEDVVIVEVNVDPIEDYKVSLNGKELTKGTDYTTTQTSKDGEWSKRTYTIKKSLFEAEGEYNIIVTSTDKAATTAFSDVKNLSLAFVVDQTKPVLTITGLEAGGRYQTDAQTVTLIPTDEGGRLNSLKVLVLDSNGNPLKDDSGADISVRFEMSGEELLKYLEENDGKVTFTVPEGLNNQVKIVCNDCAVNAEDLTNEYNELFERVTVSQNQLVIFYANTPLFVGTIVGVLAVIALIIFLIKRKKDKKNKAKAKA